MKSDLHDSLCKLCSASLASGERVRTYEGRHATYLGVICRDCSFGNVVVLQTDAPEQETPPAS